MIRIGKCVGAVAVLALVEVSVADLITPVSQTRYTDAWGFWADPFDGSDAHVHEDATDFGPFDSSVSVAEWGYNATAIQVSTILPDRIHFDLRAMAGVSTGGGFSPQPSASSKSYFQVTFDVAQEVSYRGTGSPFGTEHGTESLQRLTDSAGATVFNVLHGEMPDAEWIGILAPGRYTYTAYVGVTASAWPDYSHPSLSTYADLVLTPEPSGAIAALLCLALCRRR